MQGVGTGRVIADRYALDERRAHLGDLEVWLATDATLARQVYLTVFPMSHPHAEAILDAGRRCAAISDARLVRVYDVGTVEGSGWLVEESLADSTTLTELLLDGPLQASDARRIVGEVCEILQVAATRGLHHLHLTPHAVRLTGDGRVKVAGIAIASAIEGTPEPSAPEADRIDARGALAIGYAALTTRWPLQPPIPGLDSAPRIVGGVAAPSEIAVDVPADLDALCRAAFTAGKGPASPVELAARIAPWHPARSALVDASESVFPGDDRTMTNPLAAQASPVPDRVEDGKAASSDALADPSDDFAASDAGEAPTLDGSAPQTSPVRSFADRVLERGPRAWMGKARQRRQAHPELQPVAVPAPAGAAATSSLAGPTEAAVTEAAVTVAAVTEAAVTMEADPVEADPVEADPVAVDPVAVDPVVTLAGASPAHPSSTEANPAQSTPLDATQTQGSGAPETEAGSTPGQPVDSPDSAGEPDSAENPTTAVVAKVGSFARAAADRAAQSAATARQTWAAQRAFREQEASGPTSSLDEALDTASTEASEAPYLLEGVVDSRDGVHSRFVLGILAGLLVLALLIALPGLFRSPGGATADPQPTASAVPASQSVAPPGASAAPAPATPSATSAAPVASGATVALASASGFDPDGDKRENDDQARLAIDGDPQTSWKSEGYLNGPAISGKKGVGVIVTLAKDATVSAVTLTLTEEPQDVSVYVADRESLDGAQLLGTARDARGSAELTATSPLTGRYVIVWFTKAAPDNGKYRAWLAEMSVRG